MFCERLTLHRWENEIEIISGFIFWHFFSSPPWNLRLPLVQFISQEECKFISIKNYCGHIKPLFHQFLVPLLQKGLQFLPFRLQDKSNWLECLDTPPNRVGESIRTTCNCLQDLSQNQVNMLEWLRNEKLNNLSNIQCNCPTPNCQVCRILSKCRQLLFLPLEAVKNTLVISQIHIGNNQNILTWNRTRTLWSAYFAKSRTVSFDIFQSNRNRYSLSL